ncbi:DUF4133 domain-containing protein [Sphingobacterium sp. BS-2]|uniref:DUF4133 domain-containing protein n=1 Tax=Sphingobacterium sp. BS-2 TaxID=3377129 RepID=UPI0038FC0D4F
MASAVYPINKGINQPLEFKGLKAQYIWYLAIGILLLLFLFAGLYYLGVPSMLCLAIIITLGCILFIQIFRFSRKYGQYGLMKKIAKSQLPIAIRSRNRSVFRLEARFKR